MAGHDGPAPRTATAPQRYTGSDLWISVGSGAHPHGRITEIVVTDIIQAPRTYLSVDLLPSWKRRGYHLAVQQAHAGPRRHQRVTSTIVMKRIIDNRPLPLTTRDG